MKNEPDKAEVAGKLLPLRPPKPHMVDHVLQVAHPPEALGRAALHGLMGEVVDLIAPESEADEAAIHFQLLAGVGNIIGRRVYFEVENVKHFPNINVVIVGDTGSGRKGTSLGQVKSFLGLVDPGWKEACMHSGLSSGEGLIFMVRDQVVTRQCIKNTKSTPEYSDVITDQGAKDKRAFVIESEFASVMKVGKRDGNTLSPNIRKAWDGEILEAITKNSPLKATDAHISVVGHITKPELINNLAEVGVENGFGNRFLWVSSSRSKLLPEGGNIDMTRLSELATRMQATIRDAESLGRIKKDEAAQRFWASIYEGLTTSKPGLLGKLLARGAPYVLRIAMIYAIMDGAPEIRVEHLEAGLSVWRYAEDSARYVFGDSTGNPIAERIRDALREAPDGLTRTEIRDLVGRSKPGQSIDEALQLLLESNLAVYEMERTGGRPASRWRLVQQAGTEGTEVTKGLLPQTTAEGGLLDSSKESTNLPLIEEGHAPSFTRPTQIGTEGTEVTKGRRATGEGMTPEAKAARPPHAVEESSPEDSLHVEEF
jgi:hypothetical protein